MKFAIFATAALVGFTAFTKAVNATELPTGVLPISLLKSLSISQGESEKPDRTILTWRQDILNAAAKYDVDPALVAAILYDELVRWDRYYFNASGTRENRWIYVGDDTLTNTLAQQDPDLALEQNWSLGIAQMKPDTAVAVSNVSSTKVVKALLEETTAIDLVAAAIAKTIAEWDSDYPTIRQRPDIIGTLYSQGYQSQDIRGCPTAHQKGCPESNDRGKEIAEDVSRLRPFFPERAIETAAEL